MRSRGSGSSPAAQSIPGELPEAAAHRELVEESGLVIDGELELVGAYPMWVYGGDCLQLSYRGRVADGEVAISHEHDGARWVDPVEYRAIFTDETIAAIAGGNERVTAFAAPHPRRFRPLLGPHRPRLRPRPMKRRSD